MTAYRVYLKTYASSVIKVETDSTDPEVIESLAFDEAPGLCAHCSGWDAPGIELSDWEPELNKHGHAVYDNDGEPVYFGTSSDGIEEVE